MASGRKSLRDEIQVIRYMSELAGPTFDYLRLCVTSGDKDDKRWAVEQLMKLYPKAIPTELVNDPDNPFQITFVNYADIKAPVPTSELPSPPVNSV